MIISEQVGWKRCVACSDSRLRPGMMHLGMEKTGLDIWVQCPVCKGTQQVPRLRNIDIRTGREVVNERVNNYGA